MQKRPNPLNTTLSRILDDATLNQLEAEDLALNFEFCDLVNSSPEGPKEASKLIRKRLTQACSSRHTNTLYYTLILLETCVKNCGIGFHSYVATKDFLNDLVKVLSHKYNPAVHVQEKVLQLIQTWALAFRKYPELKEVEKMYEELKQKGIDFPFIDPDTPSLITAKQASVVSCGPPARPYPSVHSSIPATHGPPQGSHPSETHGGYSNEIRLERTHSVPPNTSIGQMQKLRQDLGVVMGNVRVLNDMLCALKPETIPEDDLQLLVELNRTCRAMQARILQLLQHSSHLLTDDTILNELLQVNDDLNNAFLKYDRFEKCHQAVLSANRQLESRALPHESYAFDEEDSRRHPEPLISFENNEHSASRPAESAFFPQHSPYSNPTHVTSPQTSLGLFSRPSTSSTVQGLPDTPQELEEMEKWMKLNESDFGPSHSGAGASSSQQRGNQQQNPSTISDEEFSKFLDAQVRANPQLRNRQPPVSQQTKDEPSLIQFD